MKRIVLCLFIAMILLTGCNNDTNSTNTETSIESSQQTQSFDTEFPKRIPPLSVAEFTLEQERFVLTVNQNPQSYSPYDKYTYARYDDIYVISLERNAEITVYVYMPDGDSYGLWIRKDISTPYIKQGEVVLNISEVRNLFFYDLSENRVSIASICGAPGEYSGNNVIETCEYFFPGTAIPGNRITIDKSYKIYLYNNLYWLVDTETGLTDYLLSQHPNEIKNIKQDCIFRITRYYTEADVGIDYFWYNITHDNQKPNITS